MGAAQKWSTMTDVCAHLDLDERTVRKLMADSDAAGLDRPWFNAGNGSRPLYRWNLALVDGWALEVGRWREEQRAGKARRATEPPPDPTPRRRRRRAPAPSDTDDDTDSGTVVQFKTAR